MLDRLHEYRTASPPSTPDRHGLRSDFEQAQIELTVLRKARVLNASELTELRASLRKGMLSDAVSAGIRNDHKMQEQVARLELSLQKADGERAELTSSNKVKERTPVAKESIRDSRDEEQADNRTEKMSSCKD